jgi:carbamate kinase
MGPKIEAACNFVTHTGKIAAIGAIEDAVRIVDGEVGTTIGPSGELVFYADNGFRTERDGL